MKKKLAATCFGLAVMSAVVWLGGFVTLAVICVAELHEHQRLREFATLLALGGELPVLLFGWLYQRLKS